MKCLQFVNIWTIRATFCDSDKNLALVIKFHFWHSLLVCSWGGISNFVQICLFFIKWTVKYSQEMISRLFMTWWLRSNGRLTLDLTIRMVRRENKPSHFLLSLMDPPPRGFSRLCNDYSYFRNKQFNLLNNWFETTTQIIRFFVCFCLSIESGSDGWLLPPCNREPGRRVALLECDSVARRNRGLHLERHRDDLFRQRPDISDLLRQRPDISDLLRQRSDISVPSTTHWDVSVRDVALRVGTVLIDALPRYSSVFDFILEFNKTDIHQNVLYNLNKMFQWMNNSARQLNASFSSFRYSTLTIVYRGLGAAYYI